MTNETITKIVDAIFEKYERAEAIQLVIELLNDRNVTFVPHVTWGTDSNGNRIKGLGECEWATNLTDEMARKAFTQ